ncbi:sugar phosphate isomerase/epimerase [Cellulophaga sp. HaHaR_3_176]|uniref:sugar phosphate isomerase/epimerase family protein n=1 Tax=Cellulophaga sp. HaHaR_3_176 TaxID=1942464 RepID=UPI001C1F3B00|nr:TIM barrel protein [Cellulophaga sp. HaHaR_3_176]QWX83800.1 sugar phosphate isomerase/epimerase [Cellulophaga sp. HaHaR_3_176]
MKKIVFIKKALLFGFIILFLGNISCKDKVAKIEEEKVEKIDDSSKEPFFKLSLAQWSMHKMILEKNEDPYTFAEHAKKWGFTGLEYVSGLYNKELEKENFSEEAMAAFVKKCNEESEKHGMQNVLIMIDGQGDLAISDADERKKAVENHYKWVDAASQMGCSSIRVNLSGSNDEKEWLENSVDGLTQLATYAKNKNINVIVENHGGFSSNGKKLAEVMTIVNMDNCGTLPDFGNFCVIRKDGSIYNGECAEEYDMYKGVEELMPSAKGVSAKSYNFDEHGNETKIDFYKMLQIVKNANYSGFIGVEYEGDELGEEEGILKTKELLLKASKDLK